MNAFYGKHFGCHRKKEQQQDVTLNVISAYAPQVGLSESIKRQFWEDLDSTVSTVPITEKLFIGGDLNGHVGATNVGFERVHGGLWVWW
jgi:hypothetical protein